MTDIVDATVGRRLRARRRLLGRTQQQIADACGVRFQQIQKYECGANRLSAAMLWRLSRALEVEVGYFFTGLRAEPGRTAAAPSESRGHEGMNAAL